MVKEVKMLKSAQSAKERNLLKNLFNWVLECILNQELHVESAKDKVKYSIKKLDAHNVKETKFFKNKKLLK